MAQKYIVQLVDDLTNEPLEDGDGETVAFALDGVSYAIDLSTDHAVEFKSALASYVNAARKADLATASKSRSNSALRASQQEFSTSAPIRSTSRWRRRICRSK